MRIRRNIVPPSRASTTILDFKHRGRGIRSTISISNTRKITARRKNRREKGSRAEFLGSNPHSKGDFFSRSLFDRELSRRINSIKTVGRVNAMRVEI